MDKTGTQNIPCTYCGNDALPGTNPPVCADHLMTKQAGVDQDKQEEATTLKELETK